MTTKTEQEARYWPTVRGWAKDYPWLPTKGVQRATRRRQCLNCGTHTDVTVRGFCVPCRERFPR